ncbi:helix-turn-helix domain-containing protein [Pseudomonas sp. NY15435]|uniref:helix-turn-helix domain-containing protein n=1 Tax=Pseudomonas sp. NY15435 TaxID=3400358 RepID=UPI003A860B3A
MFVFMTVFQERSFSGAARILKVGQPAVSGSIAKLRVHFKDVLFYRSGRDVIPTAKAERIAYILLPALKRIEAVLLSETIDPSIYFY